MKTAKQITGVAVYTDDTCRMITLVASGRLNRLRRNLAIGLCSAYRKQCPDFAMMILAPGQHWIGNYNDDQGRAIADFDAGKTRYDLRPMADNVITVA
jgi:hypothetical protein